MKILFVANNDIGLYKFRREIIESLLPNNDIYICLPYGKYVDYFTNIGCKYCKCEFDRHGSNPLKELRLIDYYRHILKRIRPDIVFTYTIKPNVYCGAACAKSNTPYVPNITGLGSAVENAGIMQKITLLLYRYGLRKAQKVFFQNAENRDFMLKHHVVSSKYELLPGSGVNLTDFKVLEYPNMGTTDFVFISRIMQEKGIDQYLECAEAIKKSYPETRFHVCGFCEESYEEKLAELDKKGIIIYHGLVDNVTDIHRISSCTIHPSYYPEGLSNVLLESCACARPIITTDRSGCREAVDDGVNGFLVRPKDSKDLVSKVEKFLSMSPIERKKMGLAGRKKVEKQFDRQSVVDKYLEEIK